MLLSLVHFINIFGTWLCAKHHVIPQSVALAVFKYLFFKQSPDHFFK